MKLIIDIDEQHFELLKMVVMNEMGNNAQKIIAQGIPLPKGHGRLIDADVLADGFEDNYEFCEVVNATPTIIEPYKAERGARNDT